jgi:hypothetical protein
MVKDVAEHQRLVRSLLECAAWPHPADRVHRIETHLSSVLLVGEFAYKIKKPVNLGFVDYSTLGRRLTSCEDEIRLNRRLAPDIYLEVVPITGTVQAPQLGGPGEPIEFAVKMRRFDEGLLLSAHPELWTRELVERLGREFARFHAGVQISPPDNECGQPDVVVAPMRQNFEQIRLLKHGDEMLARIARLEAWTEAQFDAFRPQLAARKANGFVREGHGDLHLGNIAMSGADPIVFDGIEFSCTLRCIDVMNEIAFLAMDFEHRARPDLAAWFVSAYLEETGDYGGLPLLPFYMVYRAIVRAKVAALRLQQISVPPEQMRPLHDEFLQYLALAEQLAEPRRGALVITCGTLASAEGDVAGALVGPLHGVRIQYERERRRIAGAVVGAESAVTRDTEADATRATEATYERLLAATRPVLEAGSVAIVDASFPRRDKRRVFAGLAREREVPFLILDFEVFEPVPRMRVAAGRGASEPGVRAAHAVGREPLDDAERERSVAISPEKPADPEQIRALIR